MRSKTMFVAERSLNNGSMLNIGEEHFKQISTAYASYIACGSPETRFR